ncbi:hypothetical protein AN944_00059 [Shewanella sp. P1-14-1]|nr:hypothetical protein AN944_00059 [Shewanella sp. P1-14-1]
MINFEKLGGRVYVGRPDGVLARKYFKIDEYEQEKNFPVEIFFPDNARTLTSSFFLGMFGNSVRTAGSKEGFLTRFKFTANSQIMAEVDAGISEALSARK